MREHRVYIDFYNKYFTCDTNKRMTDLHVFMVFSVMQILQKSKTFQNHNGTVEITAISDLEIDRIMADLYTPWFDVECETGLKHHYDDLNSRIQLSKKIVVVILPNEDVKQRYIKHLTPRKKLKVCTLGEFPKMVYNIIRSVDRK